MISEAGVRALVDFFLQRLSDHVCTVDVLRALSALVHMHRLSISQPTAVCRGLFDRIQIPALTQLGRKHALDILSHLVHCHEYNVRLVSSCGNEWPTTRSFP